MDNIRIIKKYFVVSKVDGKKLLLLFFTSIMYNGPYMFTSLIWSLFIKYLLQKDLNKIIIVVSVYFILKITSKIFNALNLNVQKVFYNHVYTKLQRQLVDKLEFVNPNFIDSEKKANILNIANIDIKLLSEFGNWIVSTMIALIGFVVSITILFTVSVWFMLFAIVVNTIIITILNKYNKKYETIVKETKSKTDIEIGFFNQILNGLSEIKIFNIQSKINQLYKNKNKQYLDEYNKQIKNNIIRQVISPSISMSSEMITVTYYIYGFMKGILTLDTITLLHAYFGEMFSSLNTFVDKLSELRVVSVSIERYYEFINQKNMSIKYGNNKVNNIVGEISFEDVAFGYYEKIIFENLNLKIPSKQITALIGDSGSGKSTIFNLLLRFYQPQSGMIKVDGISIFEFEKETYSHNLSIVKQDSFMFNMSIYDNLALITSDIEEIIDVCKKVQLHDFIMELPNGYDTIINEGGTSLSGGQRQRLSIARTLLKKSKIILLDEITSSLNKKLSDEIFDLLNDIKKEHTIIIITHKEEEANKCDHIFKLDNGCLMKVK